MSLGRPPRRTAPLNVLPMLAALAIAAFLGAAIGLVWQGADWFDEAPEEEVLVAE